MHASSTSTVKHILITGAAGAIGFELAKVFRQQYQHAHITLVDINQPQLQLNLCQLAQPVSMALWDLTQPDSLEQAWKQQTQLHGKVDLLINCAGIMDLISFSATGWAQGWKLLTVNFISPMRLMDLALAEMTAGAGIINISSMAAHIPLPGAAYYSAAKAGIGLASEITADEVKNRGIHILTVYPGAIKSGLESHARSQLAPTLVSKGLPNGEPSAIAAQILLSYQSRQYKLIYPRVYGVVPWVADNVSAWVVKKIAPRAAR